jgi:hypothetical protein
MKFLSILTFLCILSTSLLAFNDQDIDGVSDEEDLCKDTPFSIIVDETGCPYDKKSYGSFIFQLGEDISFNTFSDKITIFNLFFNYNYKQWDFSISSSNYHTTHINTLSETEDDLYLSIGYLFQKEQFSTKISAGTKFAFMENDTLKRDNDFYLSMNIDYFITMKQNIFFYHNYTWSGKSNMTRYEDIYSFSFGTGYALTNEWYSSLSYNAAQSPYINAKTYRGISWFNYYLLPHDFYLSSNYAYTLNDSSYDHSISLNIGVKF